MFGIPVNLQSSLLSISEHALCRRRSRHVGAVCRSPAPTCHTGAIGRSRQDSYCMRSSFCAWITVTHRSASLTTYLSTYVILNLVLCSSDGR